MAGGRRLKYSEQVQKQICDALKLGASYKIAAQRGGIDAETFRRWRSLGQTGQGGKYAAQYRAFYDATEAAIAHCVMAQLGKITVASSDDWRAAAWLLERRFPEDYGQTTRAELTGKGGGAVALEAEHKGAVRVDQSPEALELMGELMAVLYLPEGEGIISRGAAVDDDGENG